MQNGVLFLDDQRNINVVIRSDCGECHEPEDQCVFGASTHFILDRGGGEAVEHQGKYGENVAVLTAVDPIESHRCKGNVHRRDHQNDLRDANEQSNGADLPSTTEAVKLGMIGKDTEEERENGDQRVDLVAHAEPGEHGNMTAHRGKRNVILEEIEQGFCVLQGVLQNECDLSRCTDV